MGALGADHPWHPCPTAQQCAGGVLPGEPFWARFGAQVQRGRNDRMLCRVTMSSSQHWETPSFSDYIVPVMNAPEHTGLCFFARLWAVSQRGLSTCLHLCDPRLVLCLHTADTRSMFVSHPPEKSVFEEKYIQTRPNNGGSDTGQGLPSENKVL